MRRRYVPVVAAAALLVLVDQLSKSWAVANLCSFPPQSGCRGSVDVALGLHLRLAFNQGMAFSRFTNSGPVIAAIALVIVGVLVWFARHVTGLWPRIIIGIVIGGALGNLADRAFRAPTAGHAAGFLRGAVVDFFWTSWWPTFNVADAAVVVGGILLAIVAWRMPDPSAREDEPDHAPADS
jgi:signal peptidase II